MRRNPAAGAIVACLFFETGCVKFQPHELNPVQTERRFRARNLESAGLAEFARVQAGNPALAWPPAKPDAEALTYIAYFFNPDVEVARARALVAEAALATARQRINPSLGIQGGYNRTPDSVATYGVSPGFTIETAGKRGYRILEAQKVAEAARIAVYESAWQVRVRMRAALVDYRGATNRLELFKAESGVHAEMVEIFEKRTALGEAANPELNAARIELAALTVNLRNAEGEVEQARGAIAAAAGLPVSVLNGHELDLASFANPVPPESLGVTQVEKAGLLHRADIRRILAEYEAADARLRLALANQYPNIVLSPAYSFQEGFPAYTLASVIDSIPVFHRNQAPIAEQEAARHLVETQFMALQSRVLGETGAALRLYQRAFEEWQAARDTLERLQLPAEAAVVSAFRAGEADRLEVARSRLVTLASRHALLDGLQRVQTGLGALEDAVQSPLGVSLPAPHPETTN